MTDLQYHVMRSKGHPPIRGLGLNWRYGSLGHAHETDPRHTMLLEINVMIWWTIGIALTWKR